MENQKKDFPFFKQHAIPVVSVFLFPFLVTCFFLSFCAWLPCFLFFVLVRSVIFFINKAMKSSIALKQDRESKKDSGKMEELKKRQQEATKNNFTNKFGIPISFVCLLSTNSENFYLDMFADVHLLCPWNRCQCVWGFLLDPRNLSVEEATKELDTIHEKSISLQNAKRPHKPKREKMETKQEDESVLVEIPQKRAGHSFL